MRRFLRNIFQNPVFLDSHHGIEAALLAFNIRRGYRKVSAKTRRKVAASLSEFEEFYAKEYGELWPSLYSTMNTAGQHCAVVNKYASREEISEQLASVGAQQVRTESLDYESTTRGRDANCTVECYVAENGTKFSSPKRTRNGLLSYYLLDAASVLPVLALDVMPDSTVLDMCAAPGGKSVLIAQMLSSKGSLVANEPSFSRRLNLAKVIKDYIPTRAGVREIVHVWKLQGTTFGIYEPSTYDRVLVDAPCSAERHFLRNAPLQTWSLKQSKQYSQLQTKLVISALNAVATGGTIVYSTCSLSPLENDGVIENVLQRVDFGKLQVNLAQSLLLTSGFFNAVKTKYGVLILPSEMQNWGPLYFSKLNRIA